MKLTADQIQSNWDVLIENINKYISSPRKEALVKFYEKYQERIMLMPASHKKEYHNAFPGGYVEHVNRVIRCALKQHDLWKSEGANVSTYTIEELIFSALNHDLGKIGDENNESYIPQTDKWRKEKLGEDYMFNTKVPFASVPDRGLYLLQLNDVKYTFNEMLAIQTHDGLYDEANKKYFMGFTVNQKPRTSLPFIIHQADLMAARIEFEHEWLSSLNDNIETLKKKAPLDNKPKSTIKNKALSSIKSEGLKNMLDSL